MMMWDITLTCKSQKNDHPSITEHVNQPEIVDFADLAARPKANGDCQEAGTFSGAHRHE
jgi:hypothetical protein